MALPIVCGFEAQSLADDAEGTGFRAFGPPSIETTIVRTGAAALKVDAGTEQVYYLHTGTLGQTCRLTTYFRLSGTPTATIILFDVVTGVGTRLCQLRIVANTMAVELRDKTVLIGSASASLSADTWYRLDLVIMVPAAGLGVLQASLDGTQFAVTASADVGTAASSRFRFGNTTANVPGVDVFYDDIRVNSLLTSTLGLPSESDSTQTQGASKALAVSQQTETDLAQALTASRALELGQPSEADSTSSLSALKQATLGQPQETDEALPVTRQGAQVVPIGIASETDEALAIAPSAPVPTPTFQWTPVETRRRRQTLELGLPYETDHALSLELKKSLSELQREEELLALI